MTVTRAARAGLWLVPVLLLLAAAWLLRPVAPAAPEDFRGIAFHSMEWHVRTGRLPDGLDRATVQAALQAQADAVDAVLSSWRADSELSRFNRSPVGSPFTSSPVFADSLRTALAVSDWSGGAYDVTVGPLVNLWGFGPKLPRNDVPTPAEIAAARARTGWHHLHVSPPSGSVAPVVSRDAPVESDLSSLGEGAGVDAMTGWLEAHGIRDYLVSVAGTLAVRGRKPDGALWEVAVEKPDASGAAERVMALTGMAVSTSGSYRNYFEKDGVRYSHTIDPATGSPIRHHGVSVTILMPALGRADATRTDAMTTALNVLGPEAGFRLAERSGVAALFIESTAAGFVERPTAAFRACLAQCAAAGNSVQSESGGSGCCRAQ